MDEKKEKIYYDEYGKECDTDKKYAYKTETTYYIKSYMGRLVSKDIIISARHSSRYKYVKVGPNTFKLYIKYLSNGLRSYYNMANRNIKD